MITHLCYELQQDGGVLRTIIRHVLEKKKIHDKELNDRGSRQRENMYETGVTHGNNINVDSVRF